MAREDQLVERVLRKFPSIAKGLHTGIGDDAAVVRPSAGTELVITTDPFLEGVHFLRQIHTPHSVGYKALARATSDLAAMGAQPLYFLLTLAIPESCTAKWLDGFLEGMSLAARKFGLTLIGGDTTRYPTIMVSLTVFGEIGPGRAVLRDGARAGDLIVVSGKLGGAELGLRMLKKGNLKNTQRAKLLSKHLYPEPRLALGQNLANRKLASAMIDTSDGLSTDLGHLCTASGVGAQVWLDRVPLVNVLADLARLKLDPVQLALHGGEDYELLFTIPPRFAKELTSEISGVPVTIIGEITRGKAVRLVDATGTETPLRPGGWDPFRKRS